MPKPRSRAFRARGRIGISFLVPSVAAVLLSRPLIRQGTWAAVLVDSMAWCFLAAGLSLRLSSIVFVGGRKGGCLITHGPYGVTRNPLYLGSLFVALASGMFLRSLSMAGAVLLVSIFYLVWVIRAEEEQLASLFAEDWKSYVASVPRLLPRRIGWSWGSDRYEVDLRAVRNESLRVLGMLSIPLAAGILNHARSQSWWPRLWWLP